MPLLEKQLVVKRSTLKGAGKGLFTKIDIIKDTKIVEYKGKITKWKEVNDRNGHIVATFPIGLTDGVMLVSDGGQVIRTSVNDVRIAGRRTQGVTLFKVAPDEHVVSVARIDEESGNGDDSGNNDGDDGQAVEEDTSSPPSE